MLDGLLLAWIAIAWGAQSAAPWRLADRTAGRRAWSLAALPVLLTGALAGIGYFGRHPDAALAVHLLPFAEALPGRLLILLFVPALAAAIGTAWAAGDLEAWSFRITAGFALALLGPAAWMGERLRQGDGPESPALLLLFLVLCRIAVALACGELLAPGRPAFAPAGGLGLALYPLLLPPALRFALVARGQLLTAGAGAALLLASRWLPPSLRRAALLGGGLLAGIFFAQVADLSTLLGSQPLPPLPPLPAGR
jgi:hypothetical protein